MKGLVLRWSVHGAVMEGFSVTIDCWKFLQMLQLDAPTPTSTNTPSNGRRTRLWKRPDDTESFYWKRPSTSAQSFPGMVQPWWVCWCEALRACKWRSCSHVMRQQACTSVGTFAPVSYALRRLEHLAETLAGTFNNCWLPSYSPLHHNANFKTFWPQRSSPVIKPEVCTCNWGHGPIQSSFEAQERSIGIQIGTEERTASQICVWCNNWQIWLLHTCTNWSLFTSPHKATSNCWKCLYML